MIFTPHTHPYTHTHHITSYHIHSIRPHSNTLPLFCPNLLPTHSLTHSLSLNTHIHTLTLSLNTHLHTHTNTHTHTQIIYLSLSHTLPPSLTQIMIETQLYKVDQQLQQLVSLWEHRRAQLDTSRRVIEFKEAVPEVTVWLETRGVELLKNKNNFGRSREEVCTQHLTRKPRGLCINCVPPPSPLYAQNNSQKILWVVSTLQNSPKFGYMKKEN